MTTNLLVNAQLFSSIEVAATAPMVADFDFELIRPRIDDNPRTYLTEAVSSMQDQIRHITELNHTAAMLEIDLDEALQKANGDSDSFVRRRNEVSARLIEMDLIETQSLIASETNNFELYNRAFIMGATYIRNQNTNRELLDLIADTTWWPKIVVI